MKNKGLDLKLTAFDDLFETDGSRTEANLTKIRDIPIADIDDFPDHPYKIRDDEDMFALIESIKERGIITPATVRIKDDGKYELISGHRRKRACEIAGIDTLKAEVMELTHDEAVVLMVDSNLQRSTILPSEKAFSYKMRYEAIKRQAGRPGNKNAGPMDPHLVGVRSDEILANSLDESAKQIRRYIRLTELIPSILDMVDERKIAFRPAVELSYLRPAEQQCLFSEIELTGATPSLSQAIRLKQFSQKNELSDTVVESIMSEDKPNQRDKPAFNDARITKLIPATVPKEKEVDFVVKALEHYTNYLKRQDRSPER